MEDWEDELVAPILIKEQPKSKWDDEDVDENDVKESWEDEEVSTPPPEPEPHVEKVIPKHGGKASGKKGKTAKVAEEVLADPVAEKLRQQRLVEEADYKSTTELFGKRSDEKSLDNFIPKSETDFLEYAELISHKLRPYEEVVPCIVREILSLSPLKKTRGAMLTSTIQVFADAKDVASSITTIANEKLKAEKEANASKKKAAGKKKQLIVDKPDDDVAVNAYDALDDYDDFM
ncbi:uncharacterized protein LOC143860118 isoform X1 [Tasmannia lanceolata]|uniref:uncharacterized protein LOC143860118 isoform X1 n=1 Tax=Tasmannia lanceolata TaxID=3420 RepID=UPI004062D254